MFIVSFMIYIHTHTHKTWLNRVVDERVGVMDWGRNDKGGNGIGGKMTKGTKQR